MTRRLEFVLKNKKLFAAVTFIVLLAITLFATYVVSTSVTVL